MQPSIPQEYRLPLFGEWDEQFKRFLTASSAAGLLVLLVVLLAPARYALITEVTEVPERFARLILKEPKPQATKETAASRPAVPESEPQAPPPPPPRVRRQQTPVAPDAGEAGRTRAREEVSESLTGATVAAESAIEKLTASLGTGTVTERRTPAQRRRRSVSRGRSSGDLTRVAHGSGGSGVRADVAGSSVTGSLISIEPVSRVSGAGEPGGEAGAEAPGGAASGAYRSNASLLAVVRRYSAGIEFCYDNELKRTPGLRGKLVAALTVAASGQVTDVRVVSDTVGSPRLEQCVLAQIREWKFPAISGGTTVFRTPFVFTPPTG